MSNVGRQTLVDGVVRVVSAAHVAEHEHHGAVHGRQEVQQVVALRVAAAAGVGDRRIVHNQ